MRSATKEGKKLKTEIYNKEDAIDIGPTLIKIYPESPPLGKASGDSHTDK